MRPPAESDEAIAVVSQVVRVANSVGRWRVRAGAGEVLWRRWRVCWKPPGTRSARGDLCELGRRIGSGFRRRIGLEGVRMSIIFGMAIWWSRWSVARQVVRELRFCRHLSVVQSLCLGQRDVVEVVAHICASN